MSFTISNVIKYPKSTLQSFTNTDETGQQEDFQTLGGILLETNFSWLAKGPCLEVRNNKTGCKVGAWTFGYILKDSGTKVVCVDEIKKPHGRLPLLAVGLDCELSGGLICIFDVYGSKVIRAIQIKDKISSLHVVDAGFDDLNLRGPLRNFDGILAVGTKHGKVLLIDICRQICEEALQKIDSLVVRDELCPCQLFFFTPNDVSRIEYFKEVSVREGHHLAIHLNVVTDSKTEHFTLRGQEGDDRIHVNKDEVATSAVFYCPQLTSLLVGYNFGAFQLWNLSDLLLVYTSPVCEEHMPITQFCVQEPDNDPRAFCYVWAVYSNIGLYQSGLPFAVMYSFCYENKDYQEGYGYLYQDFQNCGVRFQVELGSVDENNLKLKGGYCLGLQSIQQKMVANHSSLDNLEDSLALCTICWTVWFSNKETQTNFLVFDLNQWYKEQMPSVPKLSACATYMTRTNLSHVLKLSIYKGGSVMSSRMNKKSLREFVGTQRLEEHFYPTSLSYDVLCLREVDVAHINAQGLQKTLLCQIENAGPIGLLRPADIYQQIVMLGLSPLFVDVPMNTPISTDLQREVVLNVALEQQLVGWLCSCAKEWANGSFAHAGCSLDGLVHWAFQRAVLLKNQCDKYCVPLFDYSQARLDSNTCKLLNNCTRQIDNLCTFYSFLISRLSCYISNQELVSDQYRSLQMVSVYFEVLQWLVNVGLLPECPPSSYPKPDQNERISAPYPVEQLTNYYNEKRALLQNLSDGSFANPDNLLFIDNLIEHRCGAERLQKFWQGDGGSGLYPPPSLQSLLRTYLIEGPDISYKHSLVIYVFLDLAMALEQERYDPVITHLIKFPAVFKVSPSLIKITQAFWQLDHGDYTTAMEQLLDPFVLGDDLQNWHHACALNTLLLQNQHHYALLYMQVRKPPILNEKDVVTAISLFIANNMLDEAFYFQKQYQNNNDDKLLAHLFNECNKNETLKSLLYRFLDTKEEKAFFKYLQTIRDPSTDDLQVFYFLLRSRFIEAFDIHQNSKRMKPETQGLVGQRNSTRTDNLVRFFKNLLPNVNKNLLDVIRNERTNLWKEVERPTPLSVFVHNAKEQVKYKSTVIHAALAKAKQTFNETGNSMHFRDLTTEETPFLRTPKALPDCKRRQTHVISPVIIDDDFEATPPKKMRLSPRNAAAAPSNFNITSPLVQNKMATPLVCRKISDCQKLSEKFDICTPHSILKVKNLVMNNDTNLDNTFEDNTAQFSVIRDNSKLQKSALGVSGRQSISRTPIVRFDVARYSTSFSDTSKDKSSLDNTSLRIESTARPSLLEHSAMQRSSLSSKDTSSEVFYSPDASVNDSTKTDDSKVMEMMEGTVEVMDKPQGEPLETVKVTETTSNETEVKGTSPDKMEAGESPRGRSSYKRPFQESSPVRSSPRLKFSVLQDHQKTPETSEKSDTSSEPQSSPKAAQKLRGRKSLSRQVLEHNASKLLPASDVVSIRRSITKDVSSKEVITVTKKSLESTEVSVKETKTQTHEEETTENQETSKKFEANETLKQDKIIRKTLDPQTPGTSKINVDFDSITVLEDKPEESDHSEASLDNNTYDNPEFANRLVGRYTRKKSDASDAELNYLEHLENAITINDTTIEKSKSDNTEPMEVDCDYVYDNLDENVNDNLFEEIPEESSQVYAEMSTVDPHNIAAMEDFKELEKTNVPTSESSTGSHSTDEDFDKAFVYNQTQTNNEKECETIEISSGSESNSSRSATTSSIDDYDDDGESLNFAFEENIDRNFSGDETSRSTDVTYSRRKRYDQNNSSEDSRQPVEEVSSDSKSKEDSLSSRDSERVEQGTNTSFEEHELYESLIKDNEESDIVLCSKEQSRISLSYVEESIPEDIEDKEEENKEETAKKNIEIKEVQIDLSIESHNTTRILTDNSDDDEDEEESVKKPIVIEEVQIDLPIESHNVTKMSTDNSEDEEHEEETVKKDVQIDLPIESDNTTKSSDGTSEDLEDKEVEIQKDTKIDLPIETDEATKSSTDKSDDLPDIQNKNVLTVTAQVHIPSEGSPRSVKNMAESSGFSRRVTRRSSLLLSTTAGSDFENMSIPEEVFVGNDEEGTVKDDQFKKANEIDILDRTSVADFESDKGSGRHSLQPATPLRKSRRLSQSSAKIEESVLKSTPTRRSSRARSISIDQEAPPTPGGSRKRPLRRTSIDQKEGSIGAAGSDVSTVHLPSNVSDSDTVTSRRSTRRSIQVDDIDPINLLDKPAFEGPPDPEEAKVYEKSPVKPARRMLRSASATLEPTTPAPRRGRRLSADYVDSPIVSGIKTRSRKGSIDSVSENSELPSPPKRGRKKSTDSVVSDTGSVRSTRSKAGSVSSVKTDTTESKGPVRRSSRVRKVASVRAELPEISEEDVAENGNSEKQTKKGRKT
ncbi:unnamed protein product [Brassicogethes aeneus]|uniref:Protein ELYS n=1 Tax=Brassicogethes aeneus TaxID=1431903 RepID=A0A9P0B4W3_BRAAE|nr:unnamed protein product [Brassicogethes aeneus]